MTLKSVMKIKTYEELKIVVGDSHHPLHDGNLPTVYIAQYWSCQQQTFLTILLLCQYTLINISPQTLLKIWLVFYWTV